MKRFGFAFRTFALALLPLLATKAAASPPPPPPSYVMQVGKILSRSGDARTVTMLENYVADDVQEYLNSKLVARGKADWIRQQETAPISSDRVIGVSEGWSPGGSSLLIVDQFDTVDRSKLPPGFFADPRPAVRATLYQFGTDQKIHAIHVTVGAGFWMNPENAASL